MLAIFLIPTALCFAFGEVAGDRRRGAHVAVGDVGDFVICVGVVMWAEVQGNPASAGARRGQQHQYGR